MAARFNSLKDSEPTTPVMPEEVHQILANIFKSKHFAHAPKKQKFLQLICDYYLNGQAKELNEYLIGRDVFERDNKYNPAADPIVRVGAHDIRKKLDLYYQNEGVSDEIRLFIPVGSYEPVFVRAPVNAPPPVAEPLPDVVKVEDPPAETPVEEDQRGNIVAHPAKLWVWVVSALAVMFFLISIGLLYLNRKMQQQLEQNLASQLQDVSATGLVWESFIKDSSPTVLILSNPTVHRSANESDPEVLTKKGVPLSPEHARELTNLTGNRLPMMPDQTIRLVPAINMYTGIGEAIGVYRLANLLQSVGEKTILKQSRNIGPEDLKQYDVILLGSVYSNQWSKPLSIKENFVYGKHGTIENLDPWPGEQAEYKSAFDSRSGILLEDYALISVTPNVAGDHTIMVLAGLYSEGTQAAAEFVTASHTLQELNQQLQYTKGQPGQPRCYQALLKVRVENAFPTKATLIAFRELQPGN